MKKLLPWFILLTLLLSACAPVRPIRELRIVETVGCDRSTDGTALSVCASKPALRLTQEAPSLRLAMDRMRDQAASPALFFAHTQFLLVGQALAEDDLAPALDLMARSADMRLRTPLFLVRGASAAEAAAEGDEDRDVTQRLSALREDLAQHGAGYAFSCGEILAALSERGAALAAACAPAQDALRPAGYGILKGGACVGWIPLPEAQGVNLLCGLGGHGDVRLRGATVTLSDCEASFRPRRSGEALTGLDVSLSVRAALTETDGRRDDTDAAGRAALEAELADTVRGWCEALLRRSQALGADFLNLGGRLRRADPAGWARIAPDWDAILPALSWTVTVEATLDRTLDLEAPVPLEGSK